MLSDLGFDTIPYNPLWLLTYIISICFGAMDVVAMLATALVRVLFGP